MLNWLGWHGLYLSVNRRIFARYSMLFVVTLIMLIFRDDTLKCEIATSVGAHIIPMSFRNDKFVSGHSSQSGIEGTWFGVLRCPIGDL